MLLRYHQPAWLYESLPYAYLAGGTLAIYGTHNAVGVLCGALLIAVALLVWQMRLVYRRRASTQRRARAGRRETAPQAAMAGRQSRPAAAQVSRIAWNPAFETGNPLIDRQHRQLFMRANELVGAVLTEQAEADVALMLDELVFEIQRHFRSEDTLLHAKACAATAEHVKSHEVLLCRIGDLRALHQSGGLSTDELVRFLTDEVVSGHIIHGDRHLVTIA